MARVYTFTLRCDVCGKSSEDFTGVLPKGWFQLTVMVENVELIFCDTCAEITTVANLTNCANKVRTNA